MIPELVRVCLVGGARPNFVKVAPVLVSLEARGADVVLVHSGQHYDPMMSSVFFHDLGIRQPDHHLEVGSGTHAEQTARIMTRFEPLLETVEPDVVVVVGDVNSTAACSLVAAKAGTRLAHVEAGLRSRDWAMPEEINRVVTDRLSDYLFAPSEDAVANLRGEGYRDDQIYLVGNVMVDSLVGNLDRALNRPVLERLGLRPGAYGVVTLHRPSNVDDPATLRGLFDALGKIGQLCPLVFPVHPRAAHGIATLPAPDGVQVIEPVGYLDFIALEAQARLVLTDSGGVQEETTMLGVPCLTLRETTERPLTVTHGSNHVVGTDPVQIVAVAGELVGRDGSFPKPPFWDGRAAERIADVLVEGDKPKRPTESRAHEQAPSHATPHHHPEPTTGVTEPIRPH